MSIQSLLDRFCLSHRLHFKSFWVNLICAFYFAIVLNLGLWRYIFTRMDFDWGINAYIVCITVPLFLFLLFFLILCLINVPYVGKIVVIPILLVSSVANYAMFDLGITIDAEMIQNVLEDIAPIGADCRIIRHAGHDVPDQRDFLRLPGNLFHNDIESEIMPGSIGEFLIDDFVLTGKKNAQRFTFHLFSALILFQHPRRFFPRGFQPVQYRKIIAENPFKGKEKNRISLFRDKQKTPEPKAQGFRVWVRRFELPAS